MEKPIPKTKQNPKSPKKTKKNAKEQALAKADNASQLFAILNAKTRNPKLTNNRSISDLTTTVKVTIKSSESNKIKVLHVLIETSCSKTIIKQNVIPDSMYSKNHAAKETIWWTNTGTFTTKSKCNVTFCIPEFTSSCEITFPMHVDESSSSSYDMIIGRDLQNSLGIDILWSKQSLMWDGISVPMKGYTERSDENEDELQTMFEEIMEIEQEEELFGASKLLDAKYEKADINADVEQMNHLSAHKKTALKCLLYKYEELFDGTLGKWNIPPIDFKPKPGSNPFHTKPMPIPLIHRDTIRKEIDRLVRIGILKKDTFNKWSAPSFIVPKANGQCRLVTDF
ncbi:unnamed protein product [Cylindrotheca closterium]|uniref:Reverse transcriptase domain-containing protein n=1 Tax=Cylindrotheca closterium TaxID=2856 RepID=A0AAD2CVN6_9STRA|nr:unnamed protein product [Cylindrotheca closterium]